MTCHGLVDSAAQRPRTVDTHKVLVERLGVTAAQDTPVARRTQGFGQKAAQNVRNAGTVHRHDDHPAIRAHGQRC